MGHQLRACAHCFFRGSEYRSQHPAGQLTVAGGSRTLDCFGDICTHVNMSVGLGSVKHGHTSLLTGRGSGLHSQYHKRHCSLFVGFWSTKRFPYLHVGKYIIFQFSFTVKIEKICVSVCGGVLMTVCSMIMGPGLLMQKWRHLNQSMTCLSGIHHRKQGDQTVALSGELRALWLWGLGWLLTYLPR